MFLYITPTVSKDCKNETTNNSGPLKGLWAHLLQVERNKLRASMLKKAAASLSQKEQADLIWIPNQDAFQRLTLGGVLILSHHEEASVQTPGFSGFLHAGFGMSWCSPK